MSVGNVNGNQNYVTTTAATTNATTAATGGATAASDPNDAILNPLDTYTPAPTEKSHVYDAQTIQKMWDQANSATAALRNVVASMLSSTKVGEGVGQGYYAMMADPEKFNIQVDDETRAEAEQMIGEDGYYGVKQTTGRIMEFAKALAGDSVTPEMIEDLRSGAQQGFDDVAKMYGGFDKMPEVTKKTYEAVMAAFDDWKTSITTPEASTTAPASEA